MLNEKRDTSKKPVIQIMREEFSKTGKEGEPDENAGINGVPTTAFISSALLTAIGFGLRDGLFSTYGPDTILQGLFTFALNFFLALLLIVAGVVIFQTIRDSRPRNLKIYWIVLVLLVPVLIILIR